MRASSKSSKGPNNICWLAVALALGGAAYLGSTLRGAAQAQAPILGRATDFVVPATDDQGRRSVLRGKQGSPLPGGLFEVTGMVVETYRGTNLDLVIEAPQCLYDPATKLAYSTNELSARTADGRFSIRGAGFQWQQEDSKLTISNRVDTVLKKSSFAGGGGLLSAPIPSRTAPADRSAAGSPGANTDAGVLRVQSNQFEYRADRAFFLGDARVTEEGGGIRCERLMAQFGPDGDLRRIEAEERVEITQGSNRATAARAVYVVQPGQEIVELMGDAFWAEGEREARADRFFFDRRENRLRAQGHARLKLPKKAVENPSLLFSGINSERAVPAGAAEAASAFLEIHAEHVTLRLQGEGTGQSMLAETNVVILSPSDESRATAARAEYDEQTGNIEMTGEPILYAQQSLVKADVLVLNQTNRVFAAKNNAFLRVPIRSLKIPAAQGAGADGKEGADGGYALEIQSKDLRYDGDLLILEGGVQADLVAGGLVQGRLMSDYLTVRMRDRIQSVEAKGDVVLTQILVPATEIVRIDRTLTCAELTAVMGEGGDVEVLKAERGVWLEQNQFRLNRPEPVRMMLNAATVTARFAPGTNTIDRVEAVGQVAMVEGPRSAQGERAVYDGATDLLELTGNPTAALPQGRISEAEVLIWDRRNESVRTKGKFKSKWKRPEGATNQALLMLPAKR